MTTTSLTANGHPLADDEAHLGALAGQHRASQRPRRAADRFLSDGYVYLPGLLEPDLVREARLEILTKYAVLGEIDDRFEVSAGIAGDGAGVLSANIRAFTESVRTGYRYEQVILHDRLLQTVVTCSRGPLARSTSAGRDSPARERAAAFIAMVPI